MSTPGRRRPQPKKAATQRAAAGEAQAAASRRRLRSARQAALQHVGARIPPLQGRRWRSREAKKAPARSSGPAQRLKERYDSEVRAQLVETLGLSNVMEAPRLEKIVVNMGVGRATQQPSLIEGAVQGSRGHHRPEAPRHPGPPFDRRVQAPGGS